MIRPSLFPAAIAACAVLAGCTLAYVGAALGDPGTAYLPFIAAVVVATAVGGPAWGLVACAVGALFPLLVLPPGDRNPITDPTLQIVLALYAISALLAFFAAAVLRTRSGRLDAEVALLEETFDRLADGLLTTDPGGRVVRMNRRAEHLTGWREIDARGKPLAQILRLATKDESPTTPADKLAGDTAAGQWTTLMARDGSERAVMPLVATLRQPKGDGGRVFLLRDATAWRQLERELRALIAELWRANRQKDASIAALSAGRAAHGGLPRAESENGDDEEDADDRHGALPPPARAAGPARIPEPDTQPFHTAAEAAPDSRVLMLCDDSDCTFALSMLLGLAGYDVKTATSTDEALAQASRFSPQVALIDTTMAETDGLAAARALHALCADLDLVALTQTGDLADTHALEAAGYAIALPKGEPLALKRWLAARRAA